MKSYVAEVVLKGLIESVGPREAPHRAFLGDDGASVYVDFSYMMAPVEKTTEVVIGDGRIARLGVHSGRVFSLEVPGSFGTDEVAIRDRLKSLAQLTTDLGASQEVATRDSNLGAVRESLPECEAELVRVLAAA